MEDNYIPISNLNDFIFCPYSIYFHNIYMCTDKELYQAKPQVQGTIAHDSVDKKRFEHDPNIILSLPVYSEKFLIYGVVDTYKKKEKFLIERKYKIEKIYQGQIYQIWAQYFCMIELGYQIEKIAFYEKSTNTFKNIDIPTEKETEEFVKFIEKYRNFDFFSETPINSNKCAHCIYSNVCFKTEVDHVY